MDLKQELGFIPTIVIDDGHGEETPGKRSPGGTRENEFNAPTAEKLKILAGKAGFNTLMTAPEDRDVKLSTRTDRANTKYLEVKNKLGEEVAKRAVVFVSIHFNAVSDEWHEASGVETFHYPGSEDGKRLAAAIQKELIEGTPQNNRGIKSANFYVLRKTAVPAVLVEAGFMSNKEEAKLMTNEDFQEETAEEILTGVLKYYGLEYNKLEQLKSKNRQLRNENICLKKDKEKLQEKVDYYQDLIKKLERCWEK